MVVWQDVVGEQNLGTSTTATKLSGDSSGNATDYTVPTPANTILAVRPKVYLTTPTANQSVIATLSMTSKSNYIGDFDVMANPVGGALGTNISDFGDAARWYPCNIPVKPNSTISFFGQAQVANTAAPIMGVDLLLSDKAPSGPVMHYINNGQGYGNALTSTGTAGSPTAPVSVAGVNITVSGSQPVNIRALYGSITTTTPTAQKPVAGQFVFSSPSFQSFPNPQRLLAEPIQGFLGTTTANDLTRISHSEGLDLPVAKMPATISTAALITGPPGTAGKFFHGLAYTYA